MVYPPLLWCLSTVSVKVFLSVSLMPLMLQSWFHTDVNKNTSSTRALWQELLSPNFFTTRSVRTIFGRIYSCAIRIKTYDGQVFLFCFKSRFSEYTKVRQWNVDLISISPPLLTCVSHETWRLRMGLWTSCRWWVFPWPHRLLPELYHHLVVARIEAENLGNKWAQATLVFNTWPPNKFLSLKLIHKVSLHMGGEVQCVLRKPLTNLCLKTSKLPFTGLC